MIGYIYKIENIVTKESYIGQTINILRRYNTHFNELSRKNSINQPCRNCGIKREA